MYARVPPADHQVSVTGYAQQPPQRTRPLVVSRNWEGSCLSCCGSCDETGWCTFFLGLFLPCVLFGQNRARAYRKSCFVSGFVFFVLIAIISSGYYVLRCERVHEEYCIRLPHILDHDVYQVIAWALLISSVLLIAMGTYTRCGIRRRFGLPGSDVGDCLLWTFCYPCALCQESRTLQVNNVQDGEWYGPPGGTVIPVQAMPRPPVGSSYPYQQYQPPRVVQQYQQPSASAPPVTGIPFLEAQAPPFEKV